MSRADFPTFPSHHYRRVCLHGTLIEQCRCPGDKVEQTGPCPPHCPSRNTHMTVLRDV